MTIIDIGEGYFLSASKGRVGSFQIVAIDWQHPNYGYFTDAMLWYKSPYCMNWDPIPTVNWADRYTKLEEFLEDFPELISLFETDFV
ncbi:MAG: hypothetical protein KAW47_05885 [Thermoplasmatales archaeon]|nr:hypothetical protein [Thermoplasmatales archaeon]